MLRIIIFVVLLLYYTLCVDALAAPSISGASGVFKNLSTVTVAGAGFGTKSPVKPWLWAPFDADINPSNLGIKSSWDTIGHMAYNANEGINNSGCAKSDDFVGNWIMCAESTTFAWSDLNSQTYIYRKLKSNFAVVDLMNWKDYRLWPDTGIGNQPDFHFSTGFLNAGTEGIDTYAKYPLDGNLARRTSDVWGTEEILLQANSTATDDTTDAADAVFKFYLDGVLAGELPQYTYMWKYLSLNNNTGDMTINCAVHGVVTPVWTEGTNTMWADDIYVDSTWQRVMICSGATWAARGTCEIQIPYDSWGDDLLKIKINQGAFADESTAYLYVVDAAGDANENGREITFGAGESDPTLASISAAFASNAPAASAAGALNMQSLGLGIGLNGFSVWDAQRALLISSQRQ